MAREVRHGRKRYQKGCRCEVCVQANRERERRLRTCRRCGLELSDYVRGRLCGFCLEEERLGRGAVVAGDLEEEA